MATILKAETPIIEEPMSDEELGRIQFEVQEECSREDRLKLCREIRRLREVNEDLRFSHAKTAMQLTEIMARMVPGLP